MTSPTHAARPAPREISREDFLANAQEELRRAVASGGVTIRDAQGRRRIEIWIPQADDELEAG